MRLFSLNYFLLNNSTLMIEYTNENTDVSRILFSSDFMNMYSKQDDGLYVAAQIIAFFRWKSVTLLLKRPGWLTSRQKHLTIALRTHFPDKMLMMSLDVTYPAPTRIVKLGKKQNWRKISWEEIFVASIFSPSSQIKIYYWHDTTAVLKESSKIR